MQNFLSIVLLLLQVSYITWAAADTLQPYCDYNKTEITYKTVTKTRIKTVAKKGFFNKIANKKETQVELYEDQEPVYKNKIIRTCCEGYKMSELQLCEAQCIKNGCPENSKCVEPEVCECNKGYFSVRSPHDNKHYCEPICEVCPKHSECAAPNKCACIKGYRATKDVLCQPYCASGCPHNGKCVAPNVCECPEGFKSKQGSCIPSCPLGDDCSNGMCIPNDVCYCKSGYKLNVYTNKCVEDLIDDNDDGITTASFYFEETTTSADQLKSLDVETDIETSNDDIDPNEVLDNENIKSTTVSFTEYEDGFSTTSTSLNRHKCPDDYVFIEGKCRPLKFVSNEIDCWLKPCQDKHAVCLENGTCACVEGFRWFKTHIVDNITLNYTTKAMCLSLDEYQAKIQQLEDEPQKTEISESFSWASIFFIVLGILVIVSALVYLGLKLLHSQKGDLDVEGKNLSCAYDNRPCLESEKTVI